jgi:hypothetical protein
MKDPNKRAVNKRAQQPVQSNPNEATLAHEGGMTLKKQLGVASVLALFVVTLFTLSAFATDAQMYFSSDKNGQNRVTNIQEGDEIWIVVIDNDKNIDCDLRDKVWADIKVMDPKTGAYIVWNQYYGPGGKAGVSPVVLGINLNLRADMTGDTDGKLPLDFDYLEETGADTGVFVSKRAFKVGTRESFSSASPELHTHIVGPYEVSDRWD